MTTRTTDTEVLQLIDVGEDVDIGWAIETASELVDEHLAATELSDNLLRRIEMFIAAHLAELASTGGALIRESAGPASASYADIYGEGFRSTRWGQQALALDYTGTLVSLINPKFKAEIKLV